ncbi:MAG: type II toxin-antitoxin system HipA family toxin [Myxococcaceae bacterium]|jgi:serine/threonine-protein kinase HipA|nr:type II toxin-antitoxin system HipA family toxin [Myxococcaceae bacterium]
MTLPGQTSAVPAARFTWTRTRAGVPLGQLVYGRRYLARADAVPLDPFELPLSERRFETVRLGGFFGCLRDSSPDFWGRRVIERHVPAPLDELDLLLHAPDDRAGALSFGLGPEPPPPLRRFNRTVSLERIQRAADAVLAEPTSVRDDSAQSQTREFLLIGTSMGGARPKAVIEHEGALWLAKFNLPSDRWNMARVEAAMLRLARACGITTPDSQVRGVGGRDVLLVRRFDRESTSAGYRRARMLSGLTLLGADEDVTRRDRWSYLELAEVLRRLSADPSKDSEQLFRRMVFNALTSNTDDHPRNHAAIAWDETWRLSPAYDLVPQPAVSLDRRDLALTVGSLGRWANAKNLVSEAQRFLLSAERAQQLVDELETVVRRRWYPTFRAAGVTPAEAELLQGAFVYPGFRHAP